MSEVDSEGIPVVWNEIHVHDGRLLGHTGGTARDSMKLYNNRRVGKRYVTQMPWKRVNTCGYQPSLSAIGFVAIMSDIQSVFDHELFAWM